MRRVRRRVLLQPKECGRTFSPACAMSVSLMLSSAYPYSYNNPQMARALGRHNSAPADQLTSDGFLRRLLTSLSRMEASQW